MVASLGEMIRQLRRQHGLTQTELGGEQFSKSYVSAVEREKIIPSYEAARLFAEKLNQPPAYFEQKVQQLEMQEHGDTAHMVSISDDAEQQDQEITTLLDLVLKVRQHNALPFSSDIAFPQITIAPNASQQKQALYALLQGLVARQRGDDQTALRSLEIALALATNSYHPVILDELGMLFFQKEAYAVALHYYLRALHLLQREEDVSSDLRLQVDLHCAHAYRSLHNYNEAATHYGQARKILNATHNMRLAAEIYLGLGYCSYVALYQQRIFLELPGDLKATERTFQQILSYLVQSRTLYQVCSDSIGETTARLTQARVLLEYSEWRQYMFQKSEKKGNLLINNAGVLDDAEDQCRQLLLYWGNCEAEQVPAEVLPLLYAVLACLTDVLRQRSTIARLNGYADTALREFLLAIHLCQQVLDALAQPETLWPLLTMATRLSITMVRSRNHSLLHLPAPAAIAADSPIIGAISDVFFVAGAVSEEQAWQEVNSGQFLDECYRNADQCFEAALHAARKAYQEKKQDAGYLTCLYQRYLTIMETRFVAQHKQLDRHMNPAPLLVKNFKDLLLLF